MIYYSPHRKVHRRWRGPTRLCRTTTAIQILLFLTVSLAVCGLLEMSDMGVSLLSSSGQGVLDIHNDNGGGAGGDGGKEDIGQEKEPARPSAQTRYAYKYTTLDGYFLQDDLSTVAADFDFMATNFGLIDREYNSDESLPDNGRDMTVWQRFEHHISSLNRAAQDDDDDDDDGDDDRRNRKRHGSSARYLLLFLGRHGNGYHNIAERYYGGEAWDCHYSALDGDPDGIMTWSDAHLSKEGQRQAREVNSFWTRQLAEQKMSLPELWLASPLDRAMETADITFDGILPGGAKLEAIVMEKLREGTGIHTCDRRSDVSRIRQRFPTFNVDLDQYLTETDEFWDPDRREPDTALTERLRAFMDSLMDQHELIGGKERLSITSHSGAIGALLRVLNHRQFSLGTGAVIPVLIKVDKVPLDDDHDDADRSRNAKRSVLSKDKRHGGSGEGGNHEEPKLNLPDNDSGEGEKGTENANQTSDSDANDRSKWQPIPSCPADMDLPTIGHSRWGVGLREYLEGVENGTITIV
ncbi:phosphoglycerate mutase family protein [Fonsecaea pedrosoi]|nr:phosphoglycerate mutase family protein [Fonsecaea pedrosoi]